MYRIAFDEMPWKAAPSGARFKLHQEGARQLRLLKFGRDLNHPEWCTTGHIGYLLEGEMEVEFDSQVMTYRAGDGLYIPAGEEKRHRPRAISETVRLLLIEDV